MTLEEGFFDTRRGRLPHRGVCSIFPPRQCCRSSRRLVVSILLVLSCFSTNAIGAQALRPDVLEAQHLQRQQQQQQFLQSQQSSPDNRPLNPITTSADRTRYPAETPCFPITTVELTGESAERFAWALNSILAPQKKTVHLPSPIGQCLGVQGIGLLVDHVQNAIMAAGYTTTRVLVGPQNIARSHLQLSVIPGQVNEIRFTDSSDSRARRWNALPVSAAMAT